jgi:hypothetical protein
MRFWDAGSMPLELKSFRAEAESVCAQTERTHDQNAQSKKMGHQWRGNAYHKTP